MLLRMGKFEAARQELEQSLAAKRKVLPENHRWTEIARDSLAAACEALGRREDALPLRREQLQLWTRRSAAEGAAAATLNTTARLLLSSGYPELQDPRHALALIERACGQPDVAQDRTYWLYVDTLALAQFHTGAVAAAVASQRKAIELAPENVKPQLQESLRRYAAGK